VLMRRTALQEVGPFDPRYAYVIDMELWCRLLSVGSLVAIREPLAQFRVHRESWSSSLASEQARQARELLRLLNREHEAVTRADLRAGLIRAGVNARARRLAYWLWLRGPTETMVA